MFDTGSAATRPSVLIVGAGFGGVCVALRLLRAGFTDVTIVEKADGIGGVWRENTYPGAACDVPSPLYSFSFEPNSRWPQRFSAQADILAYLRDVVARRGLADRIRFGEEICEACFDEAAGRWRVRTVAGAEYQADVLVNAVGQLSRPALPAIAGIESFRGPAFHSAAWDHDVDLTGKRVAVIGTGASAVQFVPRIQPLVQRLVLFQRSAPWVLPKLDTVYRRWHQAMFRWVPITRLAERFVVWLFLETMAVGFVDLPRLLPVFAKLATGQLRKQVADPELRAALTPDYAPGCKRALFASDYYPALTQPNATVVTEPIAEIVPAGVRTADGTVHEVDAIVYGTGFKATELLAPMTIRGLGGVTLSEAWRDGARAYLGLAVPGFPNMFLMYGPNTNVGSGSIIYMLESQARYIVRMARELAARPGQFADVRTTVADRYDERLQRRLGRSVWTLCSSWYRDAAGRIPTNWPGPTIGYRLRTRRPKLRDYRLLDAQTKVTVGQ